MGQKQGDWKEKSPASQKDAIWEVVKHSATTGKEEEELVLQQAGPQKTFLMGHQKHKNGRKWETVATDYFLP